MTKSESRFASSVKVDTFTKHHTTKRSLSPKFTSSSMSATNTRPQNFGHSSGTSKIIGSEASDKGLSSASVSPAEFLQAQFETQQGKSSAVPTSHAAYFTNPTAEDMSAYDSDVVNAIRARDIERLRVLHKEGRSMNACNRFGESLVHMACRRGKADVVSYLVNEANANVNVRDDYGRTPFHDACWTSSPNFEVMDLLLSVSDPHMLLLKDVRGHTPFDYARREHWDAWVNFLRQRSEKLRVVVQPQQ